MALWWTVRPCWLLLQHWGHPWGPSWTSLGRWWVSCGLGTQGLGLGTNSREQTGTSKAQLGSGVCFYCPCLPGQALGRGLGDVAAWAQCQELRPSTCPSPSLGAPWLLRVLAAPQRPARCLWLPGAGLALALACPGQRHWAPRASSHAQETSPPSKNWSSSSVPGGPPVTTSTKYGLISSWETCK